MNVPAWSPPADNDEALLSSATQESVFDTGMWEREIGRPLAGSRHIGWRLRLLVFSALLGCLGLFLLVRWLSLEVHVDAAWRDDGRGALQLVSSSHEELKAFEGRRLRGVLEPDGSLAPMQSLLLQRSPRWVTADAERARLVQMNMQLTRALAQAEVVLVFDDGTEARVMPKRMNALALGTMFWLLCALALVLYLLGMVVLCVRPNMLNLLYASVSLCQSANLLFIAIESVPGIGLPPGVAPWSFPVRMGLDLVTAAAMVHFTGLHPCPVPARRLIAGASWALVLGLLVLLALHMLPAPWWTAQASAIALGLVIIMQLTWGYRIEPHPFAVVLRRLAALAAATLVLLVIAVTLSDREPASQYQIAAIGSVIWYVFLASLLLLVPFLSGSQQVLREFSLLAGVSTVATSLDLLFVAVFSLGQFTSITLSLFLSLGVYAGVRQWLVNQMTGRHVQTTERMFEQLYRIAREVEAQPEKTGELLARLMRDLFEPLVVRQVDKKAASTQVVGNGSTLLVPVPDLAEGGGAGTSGLLVVRFAQHGKRMFTPDDARLTDRVVEQLRRAVAFDKAVEQGRSEERVRLAQDLHDDIGARLLTLMYKAPDPEMEDYVRHTLQDLKTLTRGLAATSHRLSHAAAEWKTDIMQRLNAAHCELGWTFTIDDDIVLTVVQWSALTRIVRELVSNAIAHAHATRVDIDGLYEAGDLSFTVSDNGVGRNPQAWSHGLGLSGVRKRVKHLGGTVQWSENATEGIHCRVHIPALSARHG
jgi:signal transduction histidine kinase